MGGEPSARRASRRTVLERSRMPCACCSCEAGRKEFDEAAAGALAPGADNRGQCFEPGADKCGRRYYLLGQADRLLSHLPGAPPGGCRPLLSRKARDVQRVVVPIYRPRPSLSKHIPVRMRLSIAEAGQRVGQSSVSRLTIVISAPPTYVQAKIRPWPA